MLLKFFESLANDPYRTGDFRQYTLEGREIEVAVVGRYIVGYWSDHAVKQVRVVKLEQVQSRL